MASITYWNRVEPSPRSNDIAQALSARVRDGLWMLTRQWQFGEFRGEDAASPAWAELRTTSIPLTAWRTPAGALQPIDPLVPLEDVVESESFTMNLATAVELGQTFETMLAESGQDGLIPDFRTAYPIDAATPADEETADVEYLRFRQVTSGRALDGGKLYTEARASIPNVVVATGVAAATLQEFLDWVTDVVGDLGTADAPAWAPSRLEYSLEVTTAPVSEQEPSSVYVCDPGRDAEIDWDTLDRTTRNDPDAPAAATESIVRTIIPANVRFRGMPNARWWDFENATLNFGTIEPERRDLSKLIVMDFMLVQSNDWFAVPLEQKVGTVLRIDSLVVHDVFGGTTAVPSTTDQRWTIFTSSGNGHGFVLPPTAGSAALYGPAIEDVRFLHDEMANMVWAVEQTIEGGLGQPLQGYDRSARRTAAPPPTPTQPPPDVPPLKYALQTRVPENWIPFIPVSIDPLSGAIALERAAMLDPDGNPVLPHGRILRPAPNPYRVAEEEVPRTGIRVQRVVGRARGVHGETHLWISRRKTASRGPGSSGLRYDVAKVNR